MDVTWNSSIYFVCFFCLQIIWYFSIVWFCFVLFWFFFIKELYVQLKNVENVVLEVMELIGTILNSLRFRFAWFRNELFSHVFEFGRCHFQWCVVTIWLTLCAAHCYFKLMTYQFYLSIFLIQAIFMFVSIGIAVMILMPKYEIILHISLYTNAGTFRKSMSYWG